MIIRTFQNMLIPSGRLIYLFFKKSPKCHSFTVEIQPSLKQEMETATQWMWLQNSGTQLYNSLLNRLYYSRIQNIVQNTVISTKICSYMVMIYDILLNKITTL